MRIRHRRLLIGTISVVAVASALFIGFEIWRLRLVLFPNGDFDLEAKRQRFHLHANEPIDDRLLSVLDEVEARLRGVEIDEPGQTVQLYLYRDLERFGELARSVQRSPSSQGFVLTLLNRVFISLSFIDEMRTKYGDNYRHTLFEGDLAHVITHEIVHILIVDEVGVFRSRALPMWKVEGYAEWAATRVPDSGEPSLRERLTRYLAGDYAVAGRYRESNVRAQLMVEYLIEVEGRRFDRIFSSEVSESETWNALTRWSASTESGAVDQMPN